MTQTLLVKSTNLNSCYNSLPTNTHSNPLSVSYSTIDIPLCFYDKIFLFFYDKIFDLADCNDFNILS